MSEDLLKDPLPEPWTFGVTQDGRIFFINDQEERTTWLHPVTNEPIMTGYLHNKELPIGWQKGYTVEGAEFYINHKDQTTTLKFPNGRNDKNQENSKSKRSRRPSFTGSLFRRSSSKSRDSTSEKKKPSRERPSSAKSSSQHQQQQQEGTSSSTMSVSRKTSFASTSGGGGGGGMKLLVMRRDPNSTVIKQGWLYKQNASNGGGGGGMKTWRKRWFLLLSDFCLFYYKDTNEGEALGSILLPSYSVSTATTDDKISRKYAFKISHPGMRTLFASAESYNDMAEWIQALTPICNLQDTKPTTTTASTPPPSSPSLVSTSPSKKKTTPPPSAAEKEGGFDDFNKNASATTQKTSKETTTKNKKAATSKNGRSKSVAASTNKKMQQQPQQTNGSSPTETTSPPRQSRAVNKKYTNNPQQQQQQPPPRSLSTPGYLDEQAEQPANIQGHQQQNNNVNHQNNVQQYQQQQQQQRPTNGRAPSQVRGRVTVLPDNYQQRPISGRSIGGTPTNSSVSSTRPLSRQEVMQHQQRMMYNNRQQTLPRNMHHQQSHATLQNWVTMKKGGGVAASEIAPRNYESRTTARHAYHHQQQHPQAHYQQQMQQMYMGGRRHNGGYMDMDNQSIMSVPAHRINHQPPQQRHVVRMPQMQRPSSSQNISVLGRSATVEPPMTMYEQQQTQQQQQQSRVRGSKSHANLNEETQYTIPQTKSDNFDHYSQQQHPERNVVNNSVSLGNESYQRHQDGQMVGRTPSFQSSTVGAARSMEVKQMDVKSFNGPNKLRAFAAISVQSPISKSTSANQISAAQMSVVVADDGAKEKEKQLYIHHPNDVIDDVAASNREKEDADEADKAEFQNRRDRLEEVKKSLGSARYQLQLLKQESASIDRKIEDAKAESSFTEQYEWQEASLHNQQKMLNVAKNLEALKLEVSGLEKNYRERKTTVLALLTNDADADVTENTDKLKEIDLILRRAKQCKVEIVNLLDYYKGGDLLESPRKSDVSANSYSSSGNTKTTNSSTLRMLRSMSCSTHNDIHDDKVSSNHQDSNSSTTSSYRPVSMKHATSVDNLTAAAFAPRSSSSILGSSATLNRLNRGRSNGRSARERLSSTSRSQANLSAAEIKKLNHDVQKNQRDTLGRNRNRSSTRLQPAWTQEQRKETDIHRAMKNHNMPKVLKKFKQQPKPRDNNSSLSSGFDFDSFAQSVEAATGDPVNRRHVDNNNDDYEMPPPPNNDEMLELESQMSSSLVDYHPDHQPTSSGAECASSGVNSSGSGDGGENGGDACDAAASTTPSTTATPSTTTSTVSATTGSASNSTRRDEASNKSFAEKAKLFNKLYT